MSTKNDIADIVVVGGIGLAGYYFLKQSKIGISKTGGGTVTPPVINIKDIIDKIKKTGGKKEEKKADGGGTTIIKLPKEEVHFPSFGTGGIFDKIFEGIFDRWKKKSKKTDEGITKKEKKIKESGKTINYGVSEPSPETWRQFTKEVYGAEPGSWVGKNIPGVGYIGMVGTYKEMEYIGFPSTYYNWLEKRIPSKKEISEQKRKLREGGAGNLIEYFERMGHGGKVTLPEKKITKKEDKIIKEKWEESKSKPSFYQSMWYKKPSTTTQRKTKKEKIGSGTPPGGAPAGWKWVPSGTGWTLVRI